MLWGNQLNFEWVYRFSVEICCIKHVIMYNDDNLFVQDYSFLP